MPIYNAERYLGECIRSLISQTYTDLEILLINDGSTDGSAAIASRYARRDSRIVLQGTLNRGQAAARNTGLELATGEWVLFVDADDYLAPDCIARLIAAIGDRDVLQYGYRIVTLDWYNNPSFASSCLNDVDSLRVTQLTNTTARLQWACPVSPCQLQYGNTTLTIYNQDAFLTGLVPDSESCPISGTTTAEMPVPPPHAAIAKKRNCSTATYEPSAKVSVCGYCAATPYGG